MKILSINAGRERTLQSHDKTEVTGIFKFPVQGAVEVTQLGIAEDFIGSPKHHGGPDQALYIYGEADYHWWQGQTSIPLEPGAFGENLTISDLACDQFNVGDVLHIGDVILQVTAPRIPCGTFARRMEDPQWVKKFRHADRPGFYVRVLQEGTITAGDEVRVEKYTGETVSLIEIYRDHYEKSGEAMLRRQLQAPISIRLRTKLESDLQKLTTDA